MPHKDPEANKAYKLAWYHANKRKGACYKQQQAYGITLAEKEQMLLSQGSKCACCGTVDPRGQGWHTDHVHGTKIIRGILCSNCNTGIGKLGDTLSGVQNAIHYLSKSEPTLFPRAWKRIAPTTCSSPSEPSDPEMPSECSSSRSSSETATNAATAGTVRI